MGQALSDALGDSPPPHDTLDPGPLSDAELAEALKRFAEHATDGALAQGAFDAIAENKQDDFAAAARHETEVLVERACAAALVTAAPGADERARSARESGPTSCDGPWAPFSSPMIVSSASASACLSTLVSAIGCIPGEPFFGGCAAPSAMASAFATATAVATTFVRARSENSTGWALWRTCPATLWKRRLSRRAASAAPKSK